MLEAFPSSNGAMRSIQVSAGGPSSARRGAAPRRCPGRRRLVPVGPASAGVRRPHHRRHSVALPPGAPRDRPPVRPAARAAGRAARRCQIASALGGGQVFPSVSGGPRAVPGVRPATAPPWTGDPQGRRDQRPGGRRLASIHRAQLRAHRQPCLFAEDGHRFEPTPGACGWRRLTAPHAPLRRCAPAPRDRPPRDRSRWRGAHRGETRREVRRAETGCPPVACVHAQEARLLHLRHPLPGSAGPPAGTARPDPAAGVGVRARALPVGRDLQVRPVRLGALLARSAPRYHRPAGEPIRAVQPGSVATVRAAHCPSSTARINGPRSVKFATSQYKPVQSRERDITCLRERGNVGEYRARRAPPRRPAAGRALRRPPRRARASSSWRTIPKPNPRSSSPPRAARTVIPSAQARLRSSSSSAVLPIPGGPSISRMPPIPADRPPPGRHRSPRDRPRRSRSIDAARLK